MATEPYYDAVETRFRALTPTQQANVHQRLATHRARLPRQVYLMALDSTITLELASPPPPAPERCRPEDMPEFGVMFKEAAEAVCLFRDGKRP